MPTITTYFLSPCRELTQQEILDAMEIMKATLNYGPPCVHKPTEDGKIFLSGDIHKLSTKSEADSKLLQAELQKKIGCDFEIRSQDYTEEVRWSSVLT